ncbi:dTDP-4-dehydrorhamnose 3,5-epimerase family protein [Streptomyces inhibens]|uniref:dTDP-4-dehydrorhamnose 3,5-epimerase family protein n=1 Tax=Streptomyces inhibens TaxID=2293571 RepID=UPI00402AC396
MEPLDIDGAYLYTPRIFPDHRGTFHESYRSVELTAFTGQPMPVAQVNCVVSGKGTLRGVHFCDVPPGQAKYVMCMTGRVFDVVVDVRVGSPTFGRWRGVLLDGDQPRGLYLAEGLGHALLALTEGAKVSYMCSQAYDPARERAVNAFDVELGIEWPLEPARCVLSDKDTAAPSLAEALEAGLLPRHPAVRGRRGTEPSVRRTA